MFSVCCILAEAVVSKAAVVSCPFSMSGPVIVLVPEPVCAMTPCTVILLLNVEAAETCNAFRDVRLPTVSVPLNVQGPVTLNVPPREVL